MNKINKLGLRIAASTALIVIMIYALILISRTLLKESAKTDLPTSKTKSQSLMQGGGLDSSADSDNDGIPNGYENIIGTNPNSADTNNNGIDDLRELTLGKNPSSTDPNNEVKPLTGNAVKDKKTYTSQYLASLPEDVARADILNQQKLIAFINANTGQLLPDISTIQIKTTSLQNKETVAAYLQDVSPEKNNRLVAVTSNDIDAAYKVQDSNPKALQDIANTLRANLEILKNATVPNDALELHKKYLAATQSLIQNTDLLVQMQSDFVGGLIGAKRIGELGPAFNDIGQQISALGKKYKL